jgi:selenide, water dikinase
MGPEALAQVLRHLKTYDHPNLLVGLKTGDDAAVYRLDAERALVQTVDFFPPVVDDPFTYGAIAAANSMSDVYAMGGEVILALNIAAFPDNLPPEVLADIFRGGAEKVAEGGGIVAGGHTITDKEPKYGLCVTGIVHPDHILTKGDVRAGDRLFLTKALGTGVITTALKQEVAAPEYVGRAVASMLMLNRLAAQIAQEVGVRGATDITGFGLLGHASEMAVASGVDLRIAAASVPLLPGAAQYAAAGVWAGGMWRNRHHVLGSDRGRSGLLAVVAEDVAEDLVGLLCDPQTSGGLLLALPPAAVERFKARCASRGQTAWEIGVAVAPAAGERCRIVVVT